MEQRSLAWEAMWIIWLIFVSYCSADIAKQTTSRWERIGFICIFMASVLTLGLSVCYLIFKLGVMSGG